MKSKPKIRRVLERLRWIVYHPRFELIYFLGGIPKQHLDTLHYRNVGRIVADLISKADGRR